MFGNSYSNQFGYTGLGSSYTPFVATPYYTSFNQQAQQNAQQMQNTQTPQPPTITNTNKIYVSGIDDVKGRFLSPNSDVLFIDNDKPILYQKTVDSKGQFEIKTFEIKPLEAQEKPKEESTINYKEFVTKDEFKPLQAKIEALNEKIEKMNVQKQIDNIKVNEPKSFKKNDSQEA